MASRQQIICEQSHGCGIRMTAPIPHIGFLKMKTNSESEDDKSITDFIMVGDLKKKIHETFHSCGAARRSWQLA